MPTLPTPEPSRTTSYVLMTALGLLAFFCLAGLLFVASVQEQAEIKKRQDTFYQLVNKCRTMRGTPVIKPRPEATGKDSDVGDAWYFSHCELPK